MSAKPPNPLHLRLLGAALKAAREKAGLSQVELTEAMKASGAMKAKGRRRGGTVGRWERGDNAQPVDAIAAVLGVSERHLLLAAAKIELPGGDRSPHRTAGIKVPTTPAPPE